MSWPTTSTGLGHIIFSIVTILGCTNEGPKMMPVCVKQVNQAGASTANGCVLIVWLSGNLPRLALVIILTSACIDTFFKNTSM